MMYFVFLHEFFHSYEINLCGIGDRDHCSEESIDYLPFSDPFHDQECVMHEPTTQAMQETEHKYLGIDCLFGGSCPISKPYAVRNLDRFRKLGEFNQ